VRLKRLSHVCVTSSFRQTHIGTAVYLTFYFCFFSLNVDEFIALHCHVYQQPIVGARTLHSLVTRSVVSFCLLYFLRSLEVNCWIPSYVVRQSLVLMVRSVAVVIIIIIVVVAVIVVCLRNVIGLLYFLLLLLSCCPLRCQPLRGFHLLAQHSALLTFLFLLRRSRALSSSPLVAYAFLAFLLHARYLQPFVF
jgi:hypothetical protein